MEIIGYIYSLIWCLCLWPYLLAKQTKSGLQSLVVCCLFPSQGSPLAGWALPWGVLVAQGWSLPSSSPTEGQWHQHSPLAKKIAFSVHRRPHMMVQLYSFHLWLCSPPPPCLPSARLVRGSHGWSSAGRFTATCSGTHSTLVLTASKLVLPWPCCLM